MNNRVTIYRLCNTDNCGPYGYLMHKLYERVGLKYEDVHELDQVLRKKERWSVSEKLTSILDKIKGHPAWESAGVPASYKVHRPGPWDDPVMKDNLRKRFGPNPRSEMANRKFKGWAFGFDSIEQFRAWFNDPEELRLLEKHGFKLRTFRVDRKHLVYGLKQVWYLEEKE